MQDSQKPKTDSSKDYLDPMRAWERLVLRSRAFASPQWIWAADGQKTKGPVHVIVKHLERSSKIAEIRRPTRLTHESQSKSHALQSALDIDLTWQVSSGTQSDRMTTGALPAPAIEHLLKH